MKNKLKFVFGIVLVAIGPSGCKKREIELQALRAERLNFYPKRYELSRNEIFYLVNLCNLSEKPQKFYSDWIVGASVFSVKFLQSKLSSSPKLLIPHSRAMLPKAMVLNSKECIRKPVDLGNAFEFKVPGTYQFYFSYDTCRSFEKKGCLKFRSNLLELTLSANYIEKVQKRIVITNWHPFMMPVACPEEKEEINCGAIDLNN